MAIVRPHEDTSGFPRPDVRGSPFVDRHDDPGSKPVFRKKEEPRPLCLHLTVERWRSAVISLVFCVPYLPIV